MALPSSGPLSLSQIAAEFGGSAPHSLSEYYGKAAGIPTSGTISIGQFYGKTNIFYVNITASVVNPNIRALALNSGWDGQAPVVVNITAPLINTLNLGTVAFPGGLTLNVSAATRIGGTKNVTHGQFYSTAGSALITRIPVILNNQGIISGAGGKGGSGGTSWAKYQYGGSYIWGYGGEGGFGQGFNGNTLQVDYRSVGAYGERQTYSGAVLGGQSKPWAEGGEGADGALWGQVASSGGSSSVGGSYAESYTEAGMTGGQPGYAIDGWSFVTVVNQGTLQGPLLP